MNIGIDISQVVYEGTGVSRFTEGLIRTIVSNDQKNHWTFFFSSLRRTLPTNIKEIIQKKNYRMIHYPIPPTLLSLLWNNLRFPKLEQVFPHLDWFISSDWTEPPSAITKKATIVHDLAYLRFPETVTENVLSTHTSRLNHVRTESNIIFSDSKATKDDLITLLHVDGKKIVVNYPGVSVSKPSSFEIKSTLAKYQITKPFILAVGKLEPRKNLPNLIEVFKKCDLKNVELIIAGPEGWDSIEDINNQSVSLRTKIKYLGYVSDKELYSLYSSCLFFIFPSLWEGFGYPLIEAMQLGAPVACSNTSSLKELGDGKALLFDPIDQSSISKAINLLLENKSLRNGLVGKGKKFATKFTWKNYYHTMITALENY